MNPYPNFFFNPYIIVLFMNFFIYFIYPIHNNMNETSIILSDLTSITLSDL